MPNSRAMAQACCPPAPPKHTKTCFEVSKPRACVKALIGRHMASLATLNLLSGPTTNKPERKNKREPPPAATVLDNSRIGVIVY
ncbi:hypothetical protein GQX74_010905 [Glossina fuscipes]|nr:hypothetical protein GQX74_010905 [Glossina fuscipes]